MVESDVVGDGIVAIDRKFRLPVLAWLHLRRVHTRIAYAEYCALGEHDLTLAQFDVLSHLATDEGISQQALADRLLVTKGNVGGLIDRLEEAGLVARSRDPDDRRSYRLSLTEAGILAFREAAPPLEATIGDCMQALNEEEQQALLSLLARLDRSLRE